MWTLVIKVGAPSMRRPSMVRPDRNIVFVGALICKGNRSLGRSSQSNNTCHRENGSVQTKNGIYPTLTRGDTKDVYKTANVMNSFHQLAVPRGLQVSIDINALDCPTREYGPFDNIGEHWKLSNLFNVQPTCTSPNLGAGK